MLRLLVRLGGLILLACAFAALIVDGTRSLAADTLVVMSLGEALATAMPAKLASLEAFVRGLHPLLWALAVTVPLRLPVWLAIGVVAAALFALTGRRRPMVGFSSR